MVPIAVGPASAAPNHQATWTATNNPAAKTTLGVPSIGSNGTDNMEKKKTPDNKSSNMPSLPTAENGCLQESGVGEELSDSFDIRCSIRLA
jgi:hypothetical protein